MLPAISNKNRVQIKYLGPHHRNMARCYAAGARPGELARLFHMSESQVSIIIHSPVFQAEVARILEVGDKELINLRKDLVLMAEKALENLDEDLHINPDTHHERRLRQNASLEVLNSVGLRKDGIHKTGVMEDSNEEKKVEELSEDDLRSEILDLTLNQEGLYE